MTTTSKPEKGSALPMTGSDGECYLCDAEATHVGFVSAGPFGAETGLCGDCWTMEYSEYRTSIDITGTKNHKRVKAPSDEHAAYYYETDAGAYIITNNLGIWDEEGPYENSSFLEACRGGNTEITDIEPTEIPAVTGNAVEYPEKTTVRAACPDCGTIATLTLDELNDHNDRAHDGEEIAQSVDDLTVSDLPDMATVRHPDQWADEFNGTITEADQLVNTDLHTTEDN